MDKVCGNKVVKKKELSFYVKPDSHLEYLNLHNDTWKHPCTGEKFSYSFFDLYDMAIVKALEIFNITSEMLDKGKVDNVVLERLFGNLDYGTGLDCDKKYECKFFNF